LGSDEKANEELDARLSELTPEQAEMFARALALAMKKRRMLLLGYLVTLFVIVFGFVGALYVYGRMERGTFIGWVFLVPGLGAALTLIIFGKLTKRLGKNPHK
jgi:hypothetical protein